MLGCRGLGILKLQGSSAFCAQDMRIRVLDTRRDRRFVQCESLGPVDGSRVVHVVTCVARAFFLHQYVEA